MYAHAISGATALVPEIGARGGLSPR